ncbi:MAG: hypothetical protein CTY31_12365 [Hyphomicrobium sp.]|nr:MAG: hypothetical protein CTY39_11985 [Hyphomicrobium sp.]PPC98806.1 MAG: hypothetical protein CTY31_12365 [Hyphomicrobium sp.]
MVAADGRVLPEDGDLPIGVGRRITAAVMFIDICGFSGRPASTLAEQEQLLRVLSFLFTELIRIIEDYGGTVEKNTGDGLMAYFPVDSTFTHHQSHRACAAAMTIFYTAANLLNPVIARSNIVPLNFRICVDHGWITVANVGAAKRFRSFVAIGTTANIACKLLKLAKADQILIGANVLAGLPENWRSQLCKIVPDSTGFVYTATQLPYFAYHFQGAWEGLRDDR